MEDLEHALTCSICMEIFESPRQLPCQHTYCEKCLTLYIKGNSQDRRKRGGRFNCPICRNEVVLKRSPYDGSLFPPNLTALSLIESKDLISLLDKHVHRETIVKNKLKLDNKLQRSKSTQTVTDILQNKEKGTQTTKYSPKARERNNFELNLFEVFLLRGQCDWNIYHMVVRHILEPLFFRSEQIHRQRIAIVLLLFFILLYISSVLIVINFDLEPSFFVLLVYSIPTQVYFVQWQRSSSEDKKLIFVIGSLIVHTVTFGLFLLLIRCSFYSICLFEVVRNDTLEIVNKTYWTLGWFKEVEIYQLKEDAAFNWTSISTNTELLWLQNSSEINERYILIWQDIITCVFTFFAYVRDLIIYCLPFITVIYILQLLCAAANHLVNGESLIQRRRLNQRRM